MMKSLITISVTLLTALTIAGCQTTGIDNKSDALSLEASLHGVGVSLPPRNPLSSFRNVPRSLSEINGIIDSGDYSNKSVSEWVNEKSKSLRHLDQDGSIYHLRIFAEKTFQLGRPRHAAAFLKKVSHLSNPSWKSETMGNNAFAATFFAAYGDFDKADSHLGRAQANYNWQETRQSCRTRNAYWMNRARAYVSLAEGESAEALGAILTSQKALQENRRSTGGGCGARDDHWRTVELYALLAKAYFQLGDFNKAESYALKTVDRWTPGLTYFGRKGLQILSQIKIRQGRYEDALSYSLMSKRAVRERSVPLSAPERLEVNRNLALSMTALGHFDSAYTVMKEIETNLEREPEIWENLFASSVDRGIILRETGHEEEATRVFRQAVTRLESQFGNRHYFAVEARMLLAQSEGGQLLIEMTRSVREFLAVWQERVGQNTLDQKSQSIRVKWIVEDYLSRVFNETDDERVLGAAFEIAETLRSGQVQLALAQTALRKLAPDQETRDLIRRQQDLKKKLEVVRQLKDSGRAYGAVGVETLSSLTNNIEDIEAAVEILTDSVRSAIPNYDNIVGAHSFKIAQAVAVLKPDEAIISLISGRKESFVWVITADGRVSGDIIEKTKEDWNDNALNMRASLSVPGGELKNIQDFDTKSAYGLYQDLLEPLQDHWRDAKHLIFVTDNDLATIPMGMMLSEDVQLPAKNDVMFADLKSLPWLIRTHATSMVPSMTSLALLRQGGTSQDSRLAFLGIGDPVFNKLDAADRSVEVADANTDSNTSRNIDGFSLRAISTTRGLDTAGFDRLPRLADTADEIIAIADIVGADRQRDLLIGSGATESNIRDMSAAGVLRQYRILSFATHGLIPGDLDGLLSPALALSFPLDGSKGDWDDGLLTAEEIMEFDLDADWVILSACNTASAQASSTEAFSGLGQAFFYAGARSLLLSNWPVFSDSTRHLMVSIFKHEPVTSNRAQALRSAMLEIMDEGMFKSSGTSGFTFSYAHPLFWAPFTLVGDGGATAPTS